MLLKAIHAQECKASAKDKAEQVVDKLRKMKLTSAAKKVEDRIEETLTYMAFLSQHWIRIRTNTTIERLNREIKRRTQSISAFPDGQSALNAYLCQTATRSWNPLEQKTVHEYGAYKRTGSPEPV